jgi:uncharacterized membrane protein
MVSPIASPAASHTDCLSHVDIPDPHPEFVARHPEEPNVGEMERTASVLAGSLLLTSGLRKFNLHGLARAYVGYRLIKRGATGQCSLYKALNVTSRPHSDAMITGKTFTHPLHQHIRVEKSITINKPIDEVFKFWRNFENLPKFMDHLETVKVTDDTHSHWTAKAPNGQTVSWDALIIGEEPNKRIAWKSLEGADVPNVGQVLFQPAPANRGTEVRVILAYDPPAGIFGALYAKLFGEEPAQQIHEDLRHLKQMLEAGETPTIEGQPKGTCTGRQ